MEKQATLALFDFDGTIIPGDSIVRYTRWARKKGAMSWGKFLKACLAAIGYTLRLVSSERSKTIGLSFRMDFSADERRMLDEEFVQEELLPIVYPRARQTIRRHWAQGRLPILVTASTENYMLIVGQELGFAAVLASTMLPDGTVGKNCKGEEKTARVRKWLMENGLDADLTASYAYGDSKSDLPMLRMCGHPVQVNPKRALRRAEPQMERETWLPARR